MALMASTTALAPIHGERSIIPGRKVASYRPVDAAKFKRSSALSSSTNLPPLRAELQIPGSSTSRPWSFSMADLSSSDDEIPVPQVKFSAEVKSLLGDADAISAPATTRSPLQKRLAVGSPLPLSERLRRRAESETPLSGSRQSSPRIVRLNANSVASGTTTSASIKRAVSVQQRYTESQHRGSPMLKRSTDFVTPGPRPRFMTRTTPSIQSGGSSAVGTGEHRSGSQSYVSTDGKSSFVSKSLEDSYGGGDHAEAPDLIGSEAALDARKFEGEVSAALALHEAEVRLENTSMSRSRADDTTAPHTTQRQRRVQVTGKFLRGPARRGMRRRQSDEEHSPLLEPGATPAGAIKDQLPEGQVHETAIRPLSPTRGVMNAQSAERPQNPTGERVLGLERISNREQALLGSPVSTIAQKKAQSPLIEVLPVLNSSDADRHAPLQAVYKIPPMPPLLPSRYDQENDPPPTFKKSKAGGIGLGHASWQTPATTKDDKQHSIRATSGLIKAVPTTSTSSPSARPALAVRSQNTPRRVAPPIPPPKMSLLETVTAAPGAASATQKRRRNFLSVNGKMFTRMDVIGKGGSSKVYRVMAENYKIFALKRVMLEDQDTSAIQGFKGEIDLLRRLANVERVVRLYDYEINEEKQTLSVLMEMGECDLNRILNQRAASAAAANPTEADLPTFDITSIRFFWKEMIECVQAVHDLNIVHSDLKPANFLLVQGRLKLIDFGISNAIADNTVNVHREQTIGTPNYMSPETLIDLNSSTGGAGKLLKLGKPSDVWSLGCILYQMVYGRAPFAHIPNTTARVMAIANPKHLISFPPTVETAHGTIILPAGLVHTLKSCLERDQAQRPTTRALLDARAPFLNPDAGALLESGFALVDASALARIQRDILKAVRDGVERSGVVPTEPDPAWITACLDNLRRGMR